MRGRRPLRTPFFSLPPRRGFAGAGAPAPPDAGAPREHGKAMLGTPGDFRFTTKVTKGVSGGLPPEPPWGHYHPPSGFAAPPRKLRHHVQLKCLRRCRNPYTPTTNTARVESGGIQGGPPPCAGGPGTRRSLAYLCLLSLREKVGRGAGRSARSRGGVQRTGRQPLLARGVQRGAPEVRPLAKP